MDEPRFTSQFYEHNRQQLIKRYPEAPIVITANGLLQRSGDTNFPFQQDANFWYLTGSNEADLILVLSTEATYLIMPPRSKVQDLFDGEVSPTAITQLSGIKEVVADREGWRRLADTLKKTKRVGSLLAAPPYVKGLGIYTNPARARLLQRLKRVVPGLTIEDLRPHFAILRAIKQPPEVEAIRRAIGITTRAFREVSQRQYAYEYEVEADLSQLFRSQGAEGHAYTPIVAAGKNACTLHYTANTAQIQQETLILVDAGAQVNHYAADITRTWSQAKPTSRQAAVLAAVDSAVEVALERLKPGVTFWDCEQAVRKFIGQQLKQLKLIKIADKESVAKYYPHAPHYLGLDVHDVGDYRAPLAPGMVLTIEPGIYIPEEGIGVRLEEDILITNTDYELLSADLPRLAAKI